MATATLRYTMANGNSGSARFTQRFTQEQKQAILRAVLADGHTVAEARKMARTGALGVPAFDIGTYAYRLIKEGRDQYEAGNEDALTRAVANELKGAEIDALAQIRAIRRGLKRDGTDNLAELAKATRDLAQIRKARKDAATRVKPPEHATRDTAEPAKTVEAASILTDLLAKTGGEPKTGSVSRSASDASSPRAA